jgi:hypothetical protein
MDDLSRLDVVAVDTVPMPTPTPAPLPAPRRFLAGSGTVGTTPKAIGIGQFESLVIRANTGNTGVLCLGSSLGSASDGFILVAGRACPRIGPVNLGAVFLVGSKPNQGFSFIAN